MSKDQTNNDLVGQFIPVTAADLERGQVLKDFDAALDEAQVVLLNLAEEYGPARTVGAQAVVTLKVTMKQEKAGYSVGAEVLSKKPARPKFVAGPAIGGVSQDGEPRILIASNAGIVARNVPELPYRKTAAGDVYDGDGVVIKPGEEDDA